ncbi:hypothetical protein KC19_5G110800 [Ceratodon purpureus]|uniref:Uncharacterized protein n=1 Tax=Ceratodon purpureus TaxID=3225 RepID=A0A8T0I1D3_CERPU|nr:hypothetical protein KC19_5G110800 [Ceratodon purpureus]
MEGARQSWGSVEEKLLTDIAKWKSKVGALPRLVEEAALIEGASVMPTGKGVATVKIGRLDWELTPPSNYSGYCETKDNWLLVSGSEFKVSVRSPYGTRPLQVCPQSDEVAFLGSQALLPLSMQNLGLREGSPGRDVSIDNLDVDDKLSNNLLARFFNTRETAASSSQKKAEIIGENFSTPFLRCVRDLQTAKSISDVLETILGLSAAYHLTQQALQQEQDETYDLTSYFYNEQVWEKDSRKNGSLWVRQQVNHAAMKCQTAAAAIAEVAEVGARVFVDLYSKPSEVPHAFQFKRDDEPNSDVVENLSDSEMDECSDEVDPDSTPRLPCEQDGLINSAIYEELKPSATEQYCKSEDFGPGAANLDGLSLDLINPLDCNQFGIEDLGDNNNPTGTLLRTHSFGSSWQSDVGNDTSSESSWEVVRSQRNESTLEDETDILGAEFSDAESLDVMLRDLDPFGKRDCSPLINDFFSLKMNSATCSGDDSDQEHSSCVQDERESKVLQRLASWSSSNSGGWTDHDILSSASSVKKTRTARLETLAEEPAYDPEISHAYRSYVLHAATEGNVLQWCSCKFNKLRCSIELKFQVGSFMEDDIATLSTGISRESPLHVEIFLDSTNVRESLLKGDVRVSAHQGVPSGHMGTWKDTGAKTKVLPPVAGMSCYIPHLVRQYLKQEVHVKRADSGYEFPDGELITGLMQYVVAQLVFIKQTCCICNHQTQSDLLTSIVPLPCEKNICQAMYGAWLVVTPPAVLELSTIEDWLMDSFSEDSLYEAYSRQFMTRRDVAWRGTYQEKVEKVAKWLADKIKASNSWLKVAVPKPKGDEKFDERETASPGQTFRDSKTQAPKRRKTLKLNDDERNWWAETAPWDDIEEQHDFGFETGTFIGNHMLDDSVPMVTSPQAPEESNVPVPSPRSLSKEKWEKASTSACPLDGTSAQAYGEMSYHEFLSQIKPHEVSAASAGPPKRSTGPVRGESSSQDDQDFRWEKILEDMEPISLKEKTVVSAEQPMRNSDGKLRFPDFWKFEKRTQVEKLKLEALGEESVSLWKRIHTQAQGESSSQNAVSPTWEDLGNA